MRAILEDTLVLLGLVAFAGLVILLLYSVGG
jgi:hypothetical protein